MKANKSLAGSRRLWTSVAVLALSIASLSEVAFAAQYTKQEQANIQLVKGLYNALDAADAKGNTKQAIVGIAAKYIAPDYKQHMAGAQSGRENFVKMFQSMPAAPAGAGTPPMEPAKLVTIMAEGDKVIQITSRGPNMIWNMFRVENGQLAEHWDAGTGGAPPGAAAGAPPAASAPAPNPATFIKDMDKNGDGVVSKSEIADQPFAADFEKMDANKDGKVTDSEWQLFFKNNGPADMDKNGDGVVSKDEIADQPLAADFEKMDANKDGKVTDSELQLFFQNNGSASAPPPR